MQPAAADLVPLGANWKYLDDGTTPQSGWQSRGFNDNAWPGGFGDCLLYTSPSPRDRQKSRMPSSA